MSKPDFVEGHSQGQPNNSERKYSRRSFLWIAGITGGALIGQVIDEEKLALVSAVAQVIGSIQPEPNLKKESRVLQIIQNPIEFDFHDIHYFWDFTNASWGIDPPNESGRRIGTIRVVKDNDFTNITSFQPLVTVDLYPEIQRGSGVAVVVGGMAVNTQLNEYYLGTATTRNDGHYDPHFELGSGIETPDSYSGRMVYKKGLPQGGTRGLNTSSYIILGADANGNYANYTFTDCINSIEDGTYQIRLNNLGIPIEDKFLKLPEYKIYIPLVAKEGN